MYVDAEIPSLAAPIALAALDELFARIPVAAFLVHTSGRVDRANGPGLSRLEQDEMHTRARLCECVRDPFARSPYSLFPLSTRGAPEHFLVVEREDEATGRERVAASASLRWRLTPRQGQVLRLLMRGWSNKEIAAELGCAVKTVELHLGAVMQRSGAESRADVLAQLIP